MWGFAALWNAISLPLLWVMPEEMAKGNYAVLAAAMFPLIGVYLIYLAVNSTREFKIFGVTELQLDPQPGAIGGHVGGAVKVPNLAGGQAHYEVKLQCVNSYIRRSGNKRKRREKVVWESAGPMHTSAQGTQVELSFRFSVPEGLPVSEVAGDDYHFWRVLISSDHLPVPLNRSFEIPVFATAESSRYLHVDTTGMSRQRATASVEDALHDSNQAARLRERLGLSLQVQADWIRLLFHRGRQKTMSFAMLAIGGPFMAVYWLPDDGFTATLFRYLFSGIGLLLVVGGLYIPLNTLDVRINRQRIVRVRSWLGIVLKKQEINPAELRSIEIVKGASSSDQNGTTQFYRLVGKGDFGKIRLAESIDDKALIESLRSKIQQFAGITA